MRRDVSAVTAYVGANGENLKKKCRKRISVRKIGDIFFSKREVLR
jgi:hypothetical protein